MSKSLEGDLEMMPLPDLIQSFSATKKTGVLTVQPPVGEGAAIFLNGGEIINAQIGEITGEKALMRIISIKQGRFQFDGREPYCDQSINGDAFVLLLNACRLVDEIENVKNELPALDEPLRIKFSIEFFNWSSQKASPTQMEILLLINNRTTQEVMDELEMEDLTVMKEISFLIRKGFVAPVNPGRNEKNVRAQERSIIEKRFGEAGVSQMMNSLKVIRRPPVHQITKRREVPKGLPAFGAITKKLQGLNIPGFIYLSATQDIKEYRHNQTGMVFVSLPAGTFKMGSQAGEGNEKPVRTVELSGFLLSKTVVTQEVWEQVMGSNPSSFKGGDRPVTQVSWNDCWTFCNKTGLGLPTEAQWEYACRAGTRTNYYWGSTVEGAYCWYEDNSGSKTHPVGSKSPNAFGLYDMSGNVWEWCHDYYGNYSSEKQVDPTGSMDGFLRVLRGGCYSSQEKLCRSTSRFDRMPDFKGKGVGFRVVKCLR